MTLNATIAAVTDRVRERSTATRRLYLDRLEAAAARGPRRTALSCGNLAHAFAACGHADKEDLKQGTKANIAIVSAYNDMLSAHQPYERFPEVIKQAVREAGASPSSRAGCPPCATASPRARRAWSCR
ncbi:MAG TPA: hypothetical protein VFG43_04170 [Geminicoccaceae bacterium]|nr:hypothetical protein [Geminicoccaceae bacterium]